MIIVMASFVSHMTVDCADAFALSTWWTKVLGYIDVEGVANSAGDEECMIRDRETDHSPLFIEIPDAAESKAQGGKNRLHLDIRPHDVSRDSELGALLGLGAVVVADHRGIHGPRTDWVVLADPEGNEFCIFRSELEMSALN